MQRYTGFWRKNIGLKIMTDKPKTEEKRGLRPKSKGDLAGRLSDGIKNTPASTQWMRPGYVFDRWRKSDVKAEQNHIAVLAYVFFALGADQAFFLGGSHSYRRLSRSSKATTSARIKPRSKSEWILPAA